MISLPYNVYIIFVIVIYSITAVTTQEEPKYTIEPTEIQTLDSILNAGSNYVKLNIPLSKPITPNNKELFNDFITIDRLSTVQVKFSNVNKNLTFIIFQVHSHLYNVTVNNNTQGLFAASGTNVGLYSSVNPTEIFYIYNKNVYVDLTVMISVHGYRQKDPIPGGCNMEFPVPISPFMYAYWQKDIVAVDASPAMYTYGVSKSDQLCLMGDKLKIEFYMMYLPEREFDAETYFDGIKKMSALENIRQNGDRMPNGRWTMSRMLSAYPGTGAIYVVVASVKDSPEYYSVYIPTHSYACDPLDPDSCELIDDYFSKIICASLIFVGVFVCYFGHRFFKTEMFLFGLLTGFIITYIIMSLNSHLDRPALLIGSLLSGAFFGAIWLTFWWYYGIPVIAVSLPTLVLGFLVSSIIYSKFPGDLFVLEVNFNFWVVFILIMLLVSVILVSASFVANILCCAVLGAFAVVYPMDFYLGSNIKYIIINTIRRATVPKFNKAAMMLPYEWRDAVIVVFWIALAITGFVFQHYSNRGRPPFPPPPRNVRPAMPDSTEYGSLPTRRNVMTSVGVSRPSNKRDERTPLLA